MHNIFRLILPYTTPLGYTVQAVSFVLFFLFAVSELITAPGWCYSEHFKWFSYVHVSLWIATGFLWEYTLPFFGGMIYFRWGGFQCVLSLLLHLLIAIIGLLVIEDIFNITLGCDTLNRSERLILSVTLIMYGVYLFCLRQNHEPMNELRDVLDAKQAGVDDDHDDEYGDMSMIMQSFRRTSTEISKEQVQDAFDHALEVLIVSEDVNRGKQIKIHLDQRIRTADDGALDYWCIVKRISQHVSIGPRCTSNTNNQYLSSSEFRRIVKQMANCLSSYCDSGDGCNIQKVPVPITSFALVWTILQKWIQCPREFIVSLIIMTMAAAISPVQAIVLGIFVNTANNNQKEASSALIMYCFLAGINPVIMLALSYSQSKLNTRAMLLCRQRTLNAVVNSNVDGDGSSAGEIVDVFTSQAGRVEVTLITSTYTMLFSTMKVIIAALSCIRVDVVMAAAFICLLPVMYSNDDLTKRATEASQKASRLEGKLASNFASLVSCLPVLITSDTGVWAADRIQPMLLELSQARQQSIFASGAISVYYLMCGAIYSLFVIIPYGKWVLDSEGDDPTLVGDFVTLVSLATSMTEPLNRLGGFMREASNSAGCIRKVDDLITSGNTVVDDDGADHPSLSPLTTSIDMKGVIFRYKGSPVEVLKGIDLSFKRGTYNVLCGLSGSGKTTLINLLIRNLQPNEGFIMWDGTEIFGASLRSYRKQVSVMFQKTMILEGTIRENILFGSPDNNDGAVFEAATMAEIADIISMLPDGYDTVLGGDSSINMSGGQLQRICLARVLYRKPSVLLLDEATSALDPETAASIVKTIVRLRDSEKLTIVSISHSTFTSRDADQIVVLDHGTIAEHGTYHELIQIDDGIFSGMVRAGSATDIEVNNALDDESSTVPCLDRKCLLREFKSERHIHEALIHLDGH